MRKTPKPTFIAEYSKTVGYWTFRFKALEDFKAFFDVIGPGHWNLSPKSRGSRTLARWLNLPKNPTYQVLMWNPGALMAQLCLNGDMGWLPSGPGDLPDGTNEVDVFQQCDACMGNGSILTTINVIDEARPTDCTPVAVICTECNGLGQVPRKEKSI